MDIKPLLELLSAEECVSGSLLGKRLGVSRTAIWKQMQQLERLGFEVETVKGRGYRLLSGVSLLDEGRIRSDLAPEVLCSLAELNVADVIESTSTYLLNSDVRDGYLNVCVAEQQTAGRGRRGREWISPYARNIYYSCSWSFEGGVAVLEGLSLAVGVALVDALAEHDISGLELKWPNDLLWCGRKLGGVLLELKGDASGCCSVVVGIGLNVDMPVESAEAVTQPWVNLSEVAKECGVHLPDRNILVSSLTARLLALLQGYPEHGFTIWHERWQGYDAFKDVPVTVTSGVKTLQGVARGVDESGALKLDISGDITLCSGGEVSVRSVGAKTE